MAKNVESAGIHRGHRERLRARFLADELDGFEDHQVLELLLFYATPRADTNPIAHKLMRRFGSLSAVLEADPKDIASVEGMGEKAAAFLSLIPRSRAATSTTGSIAMPPRLTNSEAITEYLVPLMAGQPEEVFYVLCLDSQCRVLYPALIGEGTVKEAHVHPRHVVEEALRHRAASVILAHNHPGGTAKPSNADHQLTAVLVQALGPIGIAVLDHIIVAGERRTALPARASCPNMDRERGRHGIHGQPEEGHRDAGRQPANHRLRGSGKTQVISQRIVNILREKATEGIGPGNIVAFTFTDKAAGELKDRIHRLCKEQLGSDVGLAEMYVGTIHGFCLDLLQSYEHRYLKYTVLSDVQQRLLIDRHSRESGLSDLMTHDGKPLKRWVDSRLYQKVLSMIREAEIDEAALGDHPIRQALAKYADLLGRKRYLDYSTLLTEAVSSLTTDANLQGKISERVKYLIVDEYQDVNPLQEGLIMLLHRFGAQVCVVGDDDQTIYQWNGSEIGNILGFRDRYPDVTQIGMGDNFRSSRGVVDSGRRVAEGNAARLPKTMQSQERQPYEQGDLLALQFPSPAEEAAWIVGKIQALRGRPFDEHGEVRGLTWSDCAILLRSVKNSAEPIVAALREAGVPYLVKGMNRLFETREIQAARAIFYYLNDEIDSDDLKRAWTDADLGLAPADLDQAIAWLDAERADWPNRWLTSERSLQHTFTGFLNQAQLREEKVPAGDLLGRTRGEIVYYNLGKFSQIITDYELIHFTRRRHRSTRGSPDSSATRRPITTRKAGRMPATPARTPSRS